MTNSKKSKITNSEKFKTIIFSVIVAIAVWLVAVYVNDPSITVTAKDVSVRLLNEDTLAEKGLVIKNKEKFPAFNVRVSGKRSNIMNYMNRITVDFELDKINAAGEYDLEGTVSLPNAFLALAKKANTKMSIKIAPMSKKTIRVYAIQSGTNKEHIIKSVPVENEITIVGAVDEVNQIAYAAVSVDISNVERNFESTGEIYFCDIEGKGLENVTSVNSSMNVVKVENVIYNRILVPVKAELSSELADEYVLDTKSTTISPAEISIGVLDGVKVENATVKIGKITSEAEKYRATVAEEGVHIPYSNAEVSVATVIHRLSEKTLEINVESLNIPTGMKVEYDNQVMLEVTCAENVTEQDLKATIDLNGLNEGEHSIKVKLEGENVISYEDKYINVKLIKG